MSLFSEMHARALPAHLRTMGEDITFIPARGAQREITAVPLLRNGRFVNGQLHETKETDLQLTATRSATTGLYNLIQGDSVLYLNRVWSFDRLLNDDGAAIVALFVLKQFQELGTKPTQL